MANGIRRGEVYFVELGPVRGREMDMKKRPVVVLSINDINSKPLVVTVVPGTKAAPGKPAHFLNVATVAATPENGLACETIFQGHQIRAIDQSRFPAQCAGRLAAGDLQLVEEAVRYNLGLL